MAKTSIDQWKAKECVWLEKKNYMHFYGIFAFQEQAHVD